MPNDGQSNNYIINALQDLNHEVFFVDHRHHFKYAIENINEIFKTFEPHVFLCLYLVPNQTYSSEHIKELQYKFPQTKTASWIFDTTISGKYCDQNEDFVKIVSSYDYFFTVVRGQVDSFKNQSVNAHFLQEGYDSYTLIFNYKEQDIDVSFIGQIGHPQVHQERIKLMSKVVQDYNAVLYGPIYELNDLELLKRHVGRPTFNDVEHSRVIGRSKINLGISGWPHLDGYFSARNYRILGSRGFLLSNHSKNIEEFFEPDKEIVLFESHEDCLDKIKFYLKRDTLRNQIRQAGYKRVSDNYTFVHSLRKMFNIMELE